MDMARRYRQFGQALQRLARLEIGGTPAGDPAAYAARSPDRYEEVIAASHVPLQIYWSQQDRVLRGERRSVDRFASAIDSRTRHMCLFLYRGDWRHAAEMEANRELRPALVRLGLLPADLASAAASSCEHVTGSLSTRPPYMARLRT
jgi:hypothetical protein